jgi:hypothetical protein
MNERMNESYKKSKNVFTPLRYSFSKFTIIKKTHNKYANTKVLSSGPVFRSQDQLIYRDIARNPELMSSYSHANLVQN